MQHEMRVDRCGELDTCREQVALELRLVEWQGLPPLTHMQACVAGGNLWSCHLINHKIEPHALQSTSPFSLQLLATIVVTTPDTTAIKKIITVYGMGTYMEDKRVHMQ